MPFFRNCLIAFHVAVALPCSAFALTPKQESAADEAAKRTLPEFVEFLKLPNVVQKSTADIRKNADWVEAAFKRHGFEAQQLEDGETPMVFARWPRASSAGKTVLFYAHMDGQIAFAKGWDQADPFQPVLKQKDADGKWAPIAMEQILRGGDIDPEWRLFARSAADDKAPIMMLMAAMDALRTAGKQPAINLKIIIDSHEENGVATLEGVVARNRDLLAADAVVMLDGPMHPSNKPTLVFGHRGIMMGFDLTIYGARDDVHSGHYGNFAPDPGFALARLLASMKDADGRVLIPGFYDGVKLTPDMKRILAAVPDDEAALRKRLGIARSEKVGDNYQEAMNYPTLTVTAMVAGEPGTYRSIIPSFARATMSMRTLPDTPMERQLMLVRKWVEGRGYHLVDGVPTEEERHTYPLLASIKGGGGMAALATPLDAPVGKWATGAFREAFGEPPVRIPIMGGSVPTESLATGLKAPILLIPLVNADNNQHADNENLRLGNYFSGVRSLLALFTHAYGDD